MSQQGAPVRERGIQRRPRPLLQTGDLAVAVELASLAPVAWLGSESAWRRTAWRRARRRVAREDLGAQRRLLEALCVRCPLALDPEELLQHRFASRTLQFLQYLREWRPGGWRPHIALEGAERLHAAASAGRGVILWVAPCVSSNLVTKMAVHRMGIAVRHLSDAYHGPTSSRLGRRLINRLEVAVELRYLERRYELSAGHQLGVVRQVRSALEDGAVVGIGHEPIARQVLRLPMLGGAVAVPTGPASLSVSTGAALLAVFTRTRPDAGFDVAVEGPLDDGGGTSRAAAEDRVRAYTERLERHVRAQPLCYREWWALAQP